MNTATQLPFWEATNFISSFTILSEIFYEYTKTPWHLCTYFFHRIIFHACIIFLYGCSIIYITDGLGEALSIPPSPSQTTPEDHCDVGRVTPDSDCPSSNLFCYLLAFCPQVIDLLRVSVCSSVKYR